MPSCITGITKFLLLSVLYKLRAPFLTYLLVLLALFNWRIVFSAALFFVLTRNYSEHATPGLVLLIWYPLIFGLKIVMQRNSCLLRVVSTNSIVVGSMVLWMSLHYSFIPYLFAVLLFVDQTFKALYLQIKQEALIYVYRFVRDRKYLHWILIPGEIWPLNRIL